MRARKYTTRTYYIMAIDPVHIGTGGYRLGRVDNSIIREPGTNLPKVPGTSLNGAIRQYAAYHIGSPQCAGQGGQSSEEGRSRKRHCGSCPVCYTFGYVRGSEEDSPSYAGTVNLFDARILFFPVHSVQGPVWVTTKNLLKEANFSVKDDSEEDFTDDVEDTTVVITGDWKKKFLNLGSLLLNVKQKDGTDENLRVHIHQPDTWKEEKGGTKQLAKITEHAVLVSEKLFTHIVNSNLEIRTSVSINPETGAAETGALFTYEAIPRATLLIFDVVEDLYREKTFKQCCEGYAQRRGKSVPKEWDSPLNVVKTGLDMAAMLGVGGMGTRGFGRIRAVGWYDTPTNGDSGGIQ